MAKPRRYWDCEYRVFNPRGIPIDSGVLSLYLTADGRIEAMAKRGGGRGRGGPIVIVGRLIGGAVIWGLRLIARMLGGGK